jgi:nucleoid-associated protein Lsr2
MVHLVDDLDGSEASTTVEFALDGRSYTIDPSDENAKDLREVLAPFVEAGRRLGAGRKSPATATNGAAARQRAGEIRKWAGENGFKVAERGRISAEVVQAYEAGNVSKAAKGKTAS